MALKKAQQLIWHKIRI